jgi:hypothetical protein
LVRIGYSTAGRVLQGALHPTRAARSAGENEGHRRITCFDFWAKRCYNPA